MKKISMSLIAVFLTVPFLSNGQNFTTDVTVTSPATATPNLKVTGAGGVLFSGTHGTGSIPTTGDGARLMWYPKKSAFRVGYSNGGRWDDSNIGEFSMGIGGNSVASGFAAVALGSSLASGHQSFSAGWGSLATGEFSSAMSIGTASGSFSFAAALGSASGYQSVALQGGLALGNHSVAIGSYATSVAVQSFVVGQYNSLLGDPLTPAMSDPVFVVGTGTGTATAERKNGLAVLRDGSIRMAKRQGDIMMGEFGNGGGD